jgi:hypothetical protein
MNTQAGPPPCKLVLVVAVALIDEQRRVLLAQRPAGKAMAGLWEFPGKHDGGVPAHACLRPAAQGLSVGCCERVCSSIAKPSSALCMVCRWQG